MQIDISDCSGSLGAVQWTLLNAADTAINSGFTCSPRLLSGLDAGSYKLVVYRPGYTGTYRLGLMSQ